ncbi:MAG: ExeM/NucH family extracellular endonuclease [Chitinophagaceae bacterium]
MKLKFTRLLILLVLLLSGMSNSFAQSPTDVFISEYVEGSSNNKAIELYNGTGAAIDLTSGNYVIQMYFNGSATATTVISLTGTVAPGSVFVLAQSSATFAASSFVNQTNAASWYNGDDAVVLRKGGAGGTIVDAFGQLGFDPGTEWGTALVSTADNTLRRKSSRCSGDVNASDVFDPSIEWDGFAQDTFDGLGSHSSSCVAGTSISLAPLSLNFNTTPGTPSAQQSYTVQGNSLTNDITVTIPALSNFGISTVSGGPYVTSLTIPVATANAGPVTIYIIYSPAGAGTQSGNVTHTSGTSSANLAVQGIATSGGTTPIYIIQGSGSASALDGSIVTTEGIVTADFQGTGQLNGFFIQDTTGDGNNLTSDGIFVFNTTSAVNVGDYVRLTGEVDEFFTKTELTNLTGLSILSSGNGLKPPTVISLPVSSIADLESYEGMLVTFPQTLTATETFTLGRFGEVALSAGGRLFNPTNFVDPNDNPASGTTSTGTSNVAAVTAQQDFNNRSRILLDDGSSVQNPAIVPYLNPADTTLRSGTTVAGLTGALDFDFSEYRLQPSQAPVFNYAARPSVPSVGTPDVKIASFNVLNYFNGNGSGGGFPTERGAHTLIEFNRQRTKIINAIKGLDADVVGLIEIENDGSGSTSAIADLVNGLNAAIGSNTYALIADPTGGNGNSGTDAIKVAIIYKPGKVTPSGLAKADVNPVHNRPPLAQTFIVNSSNEKFTFIVNHFKSKSCGSASGANADQLDGQGCYNSSRKAQASALLTFIAGLQASTGDPDVISVGDYNAYEQEDPMDILLAGGMINVLPGTYSYVFDGQSGSLDNALATSSVISKITGAAKWHINADEPIAKDYNKEFNPAYLYSPGPYRSSDHDPVLIGLNLGTVVAVPVVSITNPVNGASYPAGSTIAMNVNATDADGSIVKVEFYEGAGLLGVDSTSPYQLVGNNVELGNYVLTAKAYDNSGNSKISDTVRITVTACEGSGTISAEGFTGITGNSLINLSSDIDYPNHPDVVTTLNKFEYGPNVDDNYGGRVRGYICAPLTGNYIFYIASDEQSELWLSTDENPANINRIAYVETRTGFRSYFSNATQRSVPIRLIKGARYYIESLHKEGTGTDHLSVSWLMPNGVLEGPIPGSRLSPLSTPPSSIVSAAPPEFGEALRAASAREQSENVKKLEVIASPNPSTGYFTLRTKSNSNEPLVITMTDVSGRVVEKKTQVAANGTIQIGDKTLAGVYFVEVIQGSQKERVKLVKK